jgi:aspartate/methionine/tyrosine aminotransferase
VELPPFLLNDWLERHQGVQYDLGGSCGPSWTTGELVRLGADELDLGSIAIGYCPVEGSPALKEEIAAIYGVDPDWVVVTHGVTEALLLIMSALSRPNGNVLVPSPAYDGFAGACITVKLQPRYYPHPTAPFTEGSVEEILAGADDNTVLLLANSPHSPTGTSLRLDDRIALGRALAGKGVPLAVDAVYDPLGLGDAGQALTGLEETIVIGSMSKLLSLPGLRTGWIVDTDENRRTKLIRARGYTSLGGSPILEALAVHALRNRKTILERVAAIATRNLGELRSFMDRVSDILDWIQPDTGMVAFPNFRDGRDSRDFCERLADKGVLVVPGECFGMPAYIRIGFGSQPTHIGPALAILEQELRAIRSIDGPGI